MSALLALFAVPLAAQAPARVSEEQQRVGAEGAGDASPRQGLALAIVQSRPRGPLGQAFGVGYGLSATYLRALDRHGIVSVRADFGASRFENEADRGRSAGLSVTTASVVVPLGVGLQLAAPAGPVRPYANASVGGQMLYTRSRTADPRSSANGVERMTAQDGTAFWGAGGGLLVPLRQEGRQSVSLDLGAQYVSGGRARYFRADPLAGAGPAGIALTPFATTTPMLLVRLGVTLGW